MDVGSIQQRNGKFDDLSKMGEWAWLADRGFICKSARVVRLEADDLRQLVRWCIELERWAGVETCGLSSRDRVPMLGAHIGNRRFDPLLAV